MVNKTNKFTIMKTLETIKRALSNSDMAYINDLSHSELNEASHMIHDALFPPTFDRELYNIILIHVARTWDRIKDDQPFEEMPLDNIESTEAIEEIATRIINNDLLQEFIKERDGAIWDRFGDAFSDAYIERIAREIINNEYI